MQGGKHLEFLEQSALLADADLAAQLIHTLCALLTACLAARKGADLRGELLAALLLEHPHLLVNVHTPPTVHLACLATQKTANLQGWQFPSPGACALCLS